MERFDGHRLIVVENSIKLFGLGAMLEHTQRDGHELSAKFINKWIQAQRAS